MKMDICPHGFSELLRPYYSQFYLRRNNYAAQPYHGVACGHLRPCHRVKYLAKKNRKLNRVFHNIHIPLGICLIVLGLIHGLLAGNPIATKPSQAYFGTVLFTANMARSALSCPFFWARRIFSEGNLRKTG